MADNDRLADLLMGRQQLPSGGPNAKIGPQPEPPLSRKVLELITGYPANPMDDMDPLDGIQMLIGGMGAAKGLGKWAKTLTGGPSHAGPSAAKLDPFGSKSKHSRREFFDRLMDKPEKRARTIIEDGYKARHAAGNRITDAWVNAGGDIRDNPLELHNLPTGKEIKAAQQAYDAANDLVYRGIDKVEDLLWPFERQTPEGYITTRVPEGLNNGLMKELIRNMGKDALKAAEQAPAIQATDILHSYLKRFIR